MTNMSTTSFNDWGQEIVGAGSSLTLADKKASITSVVGQKSFLYKRIPARVGEKVTLSCMGRLISGSAGTRASLGIDYPAAAGLKNSIEIDSLHWKEYKLSFVVPHTANDTQYVQLVVGCWTALAGQVEVTEPKIQVENGAGAFARIWAAGLIKMASGTPSINENFAHVGISAVSYSSSTKSLTITIPQCPNYSNVAPIINVQFTHDDALDYIPKAGSFNRTTGEFTVKFFDVTASSPLAPVDISSITTCYIWVSAIGV